MALQDVINAGNTNLVPIVGNWIDEELYGLGDCNTPSFMTAFAQMMGLFALQCTTLSITDQQCVSQYVSPNTPC